MSPISRQTFVARALVETASQGLLQQWKSSMSKKMSTFPDGCPAIATLQASLRTSPQSADTPSVVATRPSALFPSASKQTTGRRFLGANLQGRFQWESPHFQSRLCDKHRHTDL